LKKTLLTISLILVVSMSCYAQSEWTLAKYMTDSSKMVVGAIGEYQINSTAFNNEFYKAFFKGSYIDKAAKDRVAKRVGEYNKIGGDISYGVYFSQKVDSLFGKYKRGFSYFVKIANREHVNALFTKDLFNVAFYGNSMYAGDTAVLGFSNMSLLRYQQLQLGFMNTTQNSVVYGVGISFIKGEQYYNINASRANLYTDKFGTSFDLDVKMTMMQSDTANRGWGAMNGWGLSTDLFYHIPYNLFQFDADTSENETDWKGYMRIEINDLGFINWNDQTVISSKDTLYHFEGIVLNNLKDLNDSVIAEITDSIKDEYKVNSNKSALSIVTPAWFHLKMYQENSVGFSISLGTIFRLYSNYSPFIYLRIGKTIKENYKLSGSLEFGGYGKVNVGIEAQAQLAGFNIGLGTHSLDGFILPKLSGGSSAYLRIAKRF